MGSTPDDDVRGVRRWLRFTGGLALLAGLVWISVPVLGIELVAAPHDSAISLTLALATWGLAVGALYVVTAMIKRGDRRAGFVAVAGTLALVLGLLVVDGVSGPVALVLGVAGGAGMVVYGITALTTAVGPRSAAER
jgi:uncharacterized membrane protein HdeD (DUF308 family)